MLTREEANAFLLLQRRGSLCFTIQQILDGVGSLVDPIIGVANKAIEGLASYLPSFSLPGKFNKLHYEKPLDVTTAILLVPLSIHTFTA